MSMARACLNFCSVSIAFSERKYLVFQFRKRYGGVNLSPLCLETALIYFGPKLAGEK
jgi:hypothetical protein